jgi:hypothetical protein
MIIIIKTIGADSKKTSVYRKSFSKYKKGKYTKSAAASKNVYSKKTVAPATGIKAGLKRKRKCAPRKTRHRTV